MKEAGLTANELQIPQGATITKGPDGKMYIVSDKSAMVIAPRFGDGKASVTKYDYDEKTGTVTVTRGKESVISRVDVGKPTKDVTWTKRVETLPIPGPVAKRFGFDTDQRLEVVESR